MKLFERYPKPQPYTVIFVNPFTESLDSENITAIGPETAAFECEQRHPYADIWFINPGFNNFSMEETNDDRSFNDQLR